MEAYLYEPLEEGKVKCTYFNFSDPSKTGDLEAEINGDMRELADAFANKDDDGFVLSMLVKIHPREYARLVERHEAGTHQGFRHIYLLDADHLSIGNAMNYRQLKHYESKMTEN